MEPIFHDFRHVLSDKKYMFNRYIVCGTVKYESVMVPWDVAGSPKDTTERYGG